MSLSGQAKNIIRLLKGVDNRLCRGAYESAIIGRAITGYSAFEN